MTTGSKYWKIRFSAHSYTQSKTGYPSGKYIWALTLCFCEKQAIMLRSVAWKCHLRRQLDYLAVKYQRLNMSNLLTWFHCHQPHSISCHRLWSWPWRFHSELCMSVNLTSAHKWITWNRAKSSMELRLTSKLYFPILCIYPDSTERAVQTKHNNLFWSEFLNAQ